MILKHDQWKYIALDIDGTLLTDDKQIDPVTREALYRIQDRGHILLLVSGRAVHSLKGFIPELRLDQFPSYLIGVNGGSIYDCRADQLLVNECLDPRLVEEYFTAWPLGKLSRAAYSDHRLITDTPDRDDVHYLRTINAMEVVATDSLRRPMEGVNKMMIAGFNENIVPHIDRIRAQFENRLYMTFSTPTYFEAMPFGIDKGVGLENFCRISGASLEEILAFGDGENDAPMLTKAGLGVAMGNASELTKAAADLATVTNNEAGIARFLQEYGFLD